MKRALICSMYVRDYAAKVICIPRRSTADAPHHHHIHHTHKMEVLPQRIRGNSEQNERHASSSNTAAAAAPSFYELQANGEMRELLERKDGANFAKCTLSTNSTASIASREGNGAEKLENGALL